MIDRNGVILLATITKRNCLTTNFGVGCPFGVLNKLWKVKFKDSRNTFMRQPNDLFLENCPASVLPPSTSETTEHANFV